MVTGAESDRKSRDKEQQDKMKKIEHIIEKKQCILSESDVTIEGSIFSAATGAYWPHEDGKPFHTFRTATVLCDGDNVTFKNAYLKIRPDRVKKTVRLSLSILMEMIS